MVGNIQRHLDSIPLVLIELLLAFNFNSLTWDPRRVADALPGGNLCLRIQ